MPRYFFHVEDGKPFWDQEGTALPNVQAARIEALRILCQLLESMSQEIFDHGVLKVTAKTEDGLTLFVLDLDYTEAPLLT